ncbi:MAG: FAD binding domain-containing protein [Treponema sp.]|jgi:CO/xanthine dehydrogenase FAD-binding subunit|nr:FAD binding domain-containing protein [Treponema sp.]
MNSPSQVYFPSGFQELFSIWKNQSDAILFAGGTENMRYQDSRHLMLPRHIISLDKMTELCKISRTERYLEIGSMVKLNQIIHLGKIVPEALIHCLECIGGPQLRNMATIGGNICNPSRRLDTAGPLIALDALYELRSAQSSRWISASRFSSLPGRPVLGPQELLTRIRVPMEPWTFTWYHKFNTHGYNKPGGGIIFILKNQKNILTDIRVIYTGQIILREKNSETMFAGKRLPLDRKDAATFVESWKNYLSILSGLENSIFPVEAGNFKPELVKTQILNFIEATIMRISD